MQLPSLLKPTPAVTQYSLGCWYKPPSPPSPQSFTPPRGPFGQQTGRLNDHRNRTFGNFRLHPPQGGKYTLGNSLTCTHIHIPLMPQWMSNKALPGHQLHTETRKTMLRTVKYSLFSFPFDCWPPTTHHPQLQLTTAQQKLTLTLHSSQTRTRASLVISRCPECNTVKEVSAYSSCPQLYLVLTPCPAKGRGRKTMESVVGGAVGLSLTDHHRVPSFIQ